MKNSVVDKAFFVTGLPHPLLAPEKNPGWQSLSNAYKKLSEEVAESDADLILYCSTQWPSVIGYMFQANPDAEWTHVDHEWHEFGEMPYKFKIDADFAEAYADEVRDLGFTSKTVNYRGFPIDTGSIVAQKFLNPDNKKLATMVSCGLYAEKQETMDIGKAAARALQRTGKKAIVVLVSCLSHRFFVDDIDPKEDRIFSAKDDEWNQKIVELLGEGRLEDVSQVAREFASEANGDMHFKGIWWLNGLCGESNDFTGKVYDYQPVWGTGNALISLTPTKPIQPSTSDTDSQIVNAGGAAEPVGAYPHARREGDLLFLSGVGPRERGKSKIPGLELDKAGNIVSYDVEEQTRAVIRNVESILAAAGGVLKDIIDVQVYLTNMKDDFTKFNAVYAEHFGPLNATRTTIEVGSLPTPIAVEFKVTARSNSDAD